MITKYFNPATMSTTTVFTEDQIKQMFNVMVDMIGSKNFKVQPDENRVDAVLKSLEEGNQLPGCKFYKRSLNSDKTVDEKHKTFVITTYLYPKFVMEDGYKLVVSPEFRDYVTKYFSEYGVKQKVLVIKNIKNQKFVPKWVNKNHVMVKIILVYDN